MSSTRTVMLNDMCKMPVIGFGTGTAHMFSPQETGKALEAAIDAGYRLFDFSTMYETMRFCGPVLEKRKNLRSEMYITVKGGEAFTPPDKFDMHGWAMKAMKQLGIDYIDLFMIHLPEMVSDIPKAWRQMEQLQQQGLVRSIGVSGFTTKDLEILLSSCKVKPAVLQIELHPHAWPTYLPTLVPLAQQHNIRLQPVSALVPLIYKAGGAVETQVKSVAEERNRKEDPAQILLMWAQQITEGSVVTTSKKPDKIATLLEPFLVESNVPP